MPKRKTVKINCEKLLNMVAENGWSASTFSKKVGKYRTWLSEVSRGNNLPSPEEAARMCAILQVTPEEILTEQADIELVRGLIDSQKPGQNEKADPTKGTGLSLAKKKLIAAIDELSDEQCEKLFGIIEEAKKLL